MAHPRERGAKGERIAEEYLAQRGWKVLDRNFRDGPRELDLVAWRSGVLAFVEVKSRGGTLWGDPLEAITYRKRRELETAARAWLRRHSEAAEEVRFDAVTVVWDRRGIPSVVHVPDAWRPGGP